MLRDVDLKQGRNEVRIFRRDIDVSRAQEEEEEEAERYTNCDRKCNVPLPTKKAHVTIMLEYLTLQQCRYLTFLEASIFHLEQE